MKTKKKSGITIYVPEKNAMHAHYPRQSDPQPAYITLDPKTAALSASYNGEIGNAVPMSVYHGRIRRYGCPALKDSAALELMENIAPLAARVIAGYETEWNGNNMIGVLNDDATEAEEKISSMIDGTEEDDMLSVWAASNWLDNVTYRHDEDGNQTWRTKKSIKSVTINEFGIVTAKTTDDEITVMAQKIDADAASENILLDHESAEKYLSDLREQCEPDEENE